MNSNVRAIKSIVNDSGGAYQNRILIGTACTGMVRVEWVAARYSQIIPMNWSQVQSNQYMSGYYPLRYQVDDAQNILVAQALAGDFEWLFLLEHDVCLPDMTMMLLNKYMRQGDVPIVSGLYYSRSRPSEPLVFRGRGNSVYDEWEESPGKAKAGQELIWCDGVPTGCLLIHHTVLRLMWNESAEYMVNGQVLRRIFETPRRLEVFESMHNSISGTSDLNWCDRLMREKVLERLGWDKKIPDMKNPFLIDTAIFCRHINPNGEQFP